MNRTTATFVYTHTGAGTGKQIKTSGDLAADYNYIKNIAGIT